MSDPNNTDRYRELNQTALDSSIEECGTEAEIAFHESNLKRHKTMDEIKSADDFLRGQKDCQEGIPAKQEQSTDYQRGYATEYQHQANMDAMTDGH
jgi:hypothetical protein